MKKRRTAWGFLFAAAYALAAVTLLARWSGSQLFPKTLDVFLVGIVAAAYVFSWLPALFLLLASLPLTIYFVLPPTGNLRLEDPADVFRLLSYAAVSVGLIATIRHLQTVRERIESLAHRRASELTALAEARAKLLQEQAQLIDLSQDAIIACDAECKVTRWNAGAAEVYQWTEAEALGREIHRLLNTQPPGLADEIDRELRRAGRWDGELMHTRRDGTRIVVESRQILLRNEAGEPFGRLEVNRDITERKQGEEALRISELRRRLAMEAAGMGTWLWDFSRDDLIWDEECKSLFGLPSDAQVSYASFLAAIHPEDRERTQQAIDGTLNEGKEYSTTFRAVWPDGRVRWIVARGQAYHGADGAIAGMQGIAFDITDRRTAEEELRETHETLNAVIRNSPLPIWALDLDGRIALWNPAAERLFGWRETEILGQFIPNVLDVEKFFQVLESARSGAAVLGVEDRRKKKDGSLIDVSVSVATLRDAAGTVNGFISIVVDLTEKKRLDRQLLEAQKAESIGLLAGGIAHDFNNLLTAILGNASLAAEMTPPAASRPLQDVIEASQRAAQLTEQLLAYAGKGRYFVERIDLSALIAESAGLIRAAVPKRVELQLLPAQGLPLVEADPNQIRQIVMNLVANGVEAIEPGKGGIVAIATGTRSLDTEFIRLHAAGQGASPGEYVYLEVRDNGCGMEEATKARIFEPFFSTKFTGRGLGLAAVMGIVRAHQGLIQVDSVPGGGATFRVYLPCAVTRRPAPERAGPAMEGEPKGAGTVLVVDDEEMIRKMAGAALERQGYRTLAAPNGREAMLILDRTSVGTISLVLLDLLMPAMGGEETLWSIKKRFPQIKVILSSGYAEEEARRRFGSTGASAFIQKPYTSKTLVAAIKAVLNGSLQL